MPGNVSVSKTKINKPMNNTEILTMLSFVVYNAFICKSYLMLVMALDGARC